MDVKEAKRLEALEKRLIEKFRSAEVEERAERARTADENPVLPLSLAPPVFKPSVLTPRVSTIAMPTPPSQPLPLSVSKAKRLAGLSTRLQNEFAEVHATEMAEQQEREKKYEAITKAIKQKKEEDELAAAKNKESAQKRRYNQIMRRVGGKRRFAPSVSGTHDRPGVGYIGGNDNDDDDDGDDDDNDDDDKDNMEIEEAPQLSLSNKSMKQLMDTRVVNLGAIGTRYLPKAHDSQFGIYYDDESEQLKIGSATVTFDFDDILVNDKRYRGTEGLWRLLTIKGFVNENAYTADDWRLYKDILLTTHTLHQKNDPTCRRPKASQGSKWKKLIRPVWEEDVKTHFAPTAAPAADETMATGSGLVEYNERPIEYRYVNNLNELINRLNFIYAQETAGNRSFTNEKLSVVRFIHDRMEELVQRPNGLKYLLRCLSALPQHVIEGSGLLNDMINKLPFELHAPSSWTFDTYNYCGPGTRLDARLARGDKGINPLDEACKRHDIWYRDHKNVEDRWVADKALQKAAWDRVKSHDAGLNERAVGLATTGTMWLKRKLGMGLGTSCCTLYK